MSTREKREQRKTQKARFVAMYPGLSHDEIIEECLKELKHHFEVGPEVALISAEKGVQCVPFDESLQKKFPYFEGTYEVFDVPHTDFQIRYQPEQILAASGRKILTGTAFLCRRENERCLMLPSRYEKVDVEDFIREHLFFYDDPNCLCAHGKAYPFRPRQEAGSHCSRSQDPPPIGWFRYNSCTSSHTTFKTEIRLSDYQTPIESATSQNHRFRRCPATGHR